MKLSIVTVVRNDRSGLLATHASLVGQRFEEFQWILIDGESTDGTAELCRQMIRDGKAEGISEPDNGVYDAMNKSFRFATGDYLLFLNAGDVLASADVLEKLVNVIDQLRVPRLICADYILRMENGLEIYRRWDPKKRWYTQPTSHQAMLFPRGQLFDVMHDTTLRIKGDYKVYSHILTHYGPEVHADVAVSVFAHGGLSSARPWLAAKEHWRVDRKVRSRSIPFAMLVQVRCLASVVARALINRFPRRQGAGK